MSSRVLVAALPLLALFASNSPKTEPSGAVAEILRSHEMDREDHLRGDAAHLASRLPPEYISVADGKLKRETREATLKQFQDYFTGRKHRAWEDVEPPVVHVAPSGDMAWAIFRVRSRYTDTKPDGSRQDGEFVCAWTSTYEKSDGQWWMTSVTSTFEPQH
jgi:ketosteroid isomerase-like protein